MKKINFALLIALFAPVIAWAGETASGYVNTAGWESKTADATHNDLMKHFKQTMPEVKGDAFVEGGVNFNAGAAAYAKIWYDRLNDDFDQPEEYAKAIAHGKALWETKFANGNTMTSCFPHGGKGAANMYPRVNPGTGKVETFEWALNKCRTDNGEKPLAYDDMKEMGALSIVARRLSNGERINMHIKTDGEKAAFERGKKLFYGRFGNFEQACAHCHIQHAGQIARTENLSPIVGQAAHFPVFRPAKETGELSIVTLHKRYEGCQNSTAVDKKNQIKPGSDDSNDLEYFHTYISNGMPLSSGVFRK